MLAAWFSGSEDCRRAHAAGSAEPLALRCGWAEAQSGTLALQLGATLARVAVAFVIAMAAGTALGVWMGRSRLADRLADPWVIALLNLPALVIIVLAYVWAGLNETAAITAVVLNKLPNATITVREGARSFDRSLDEMAQVFRMSFRMRLPPCSRSPACALSRGGRALGPVARVEDRTDRRIAGTAERRRLRDHGCVPTL